MLFAGMYIKDYFFPPKEKAKTHKEILNEARSKNKSCDDHDGEPKSNEQKQKR